MSAKFKMFKTGINDIPDDWKSILHDEEKLKLNIIHDLCDQGLVERGSIHCSSTLIHEGILYFYFSIKDNGDINFQVN